MTSELTYFERSPLLPFELHVISFFVGIEIGTILEYCYIDQCIIYHIFPLIVACTVCIHVAICRLTLLNEN